MELTDPGAGNSGLPGRARPRADRVEMAAPAHSFPCNPLQLRDIGTMGAILAIRVQISYPDALRCQ